MVISILKYLFFNLYCQLQVVNSLKYVKWQFIIRIEIFNKHLRLGEMVYSNMQSIKSLSALSKKCNISHSDKQKYISHMYAIDVYD